MTHGPVRHCAEQALTGADHALRCARPREHDGSHYDADCYVWWSHDLEPEDLMVSHPDDCGDDCDLILQALYGTPPPLVGPLPGQKVMTEAERLQASGHIPKLVPPSQTANTAEPASTPDVD